MADELRIIREYNSDKKAYLTRAVSGVPTTGGGGEDVTLGHVGPAGQPGIAFGTPADTMFYRVNAQTIRTESAMVIAGAATGANGQVLFGYSFNGYGFAIGTDAGTVSVVRTGAKLLSTNAKFKPTSLQLPVKAGTPTDADVVGGAADGDAVVDTTNSRLYVRVGGAWKSVVLA